MVIQKTMPKVQAWERLNDPQHCGNLKMGEFYDLMVAAGYSEETAQEAANERGSRRLSQGMQM